MGEKFDISGKVVMITGALGQLGSEITRELLENGAKVAISDLDEDKCKNAASDFNNKFKNSVFGIGCDITQEKSVEKFFAETYKKFGKIDALINNAGIGIFTPFEKRTPEEIDRVMDVNIKGTILCSKHAFNVMKKSGKGSIINIASIYGLVSSNKEIYGDSGRNNSEIYGMTKAAIINFTKYLAAYSAEFGIRVNAISPGGIFNGQKEVFVKNYTNKVPMKRMGSAKDMVGAAIYLISDSSSYMTGNNLVIDGGFTVW